MIAVLDDDPTGAQSQTGVPLLAAWTPELLAKICTRRPPAVHLLTNSRALEPGAAYHVVREACEAVAATLPEARVVLRGDSTLRGHLLEEYAAVRDGIYGGAETALLLVLALPAAGRVTTDGVHRLIRDSIPVALEQTEYAHDAGFSYTAARLLEWAAERSAGHFAPSHGIELPLARLRDGGAELVATALAEAAGRAPAVVVPDAYEEADLALIAAGLRRAWDAGTPVIVRCAPALVGHLAGTTAGSLVSAKRARRGLLVACGSHVPATTRQLARLYERRPDAFTEVSAAALADDPEPTVAAAVRSAAATLAREKVAVVATSRALDAGGLAHGQRIAAGLAQIVAALRSLVDVLVSKGGITSAVNLRAGLGVEEAEVIGPVAPGISLWSVITPEHQAVSYVVFPGNVGGDGALADVVDALAPA